MVTQIAKSAALLSLVMLIVPSLLYLSGIMELDKVKLIMGICTVVWFVSAAVWMWDKSENKTGASEESK
ncbi:hypothetical protein SMSP2_01981 [Limihaloglobus sulfuriphilus]|uniref:Uncharacterized protein n=1 Tax=Limihaloglobus sulfuriphilus TaxID=1851148 RepID=A0A1Q2MFX9_9BACT|nr:hypothetical protein [Limihaloglobus sulfuriphilus]AQQ71605.1 hypothetical protein SMSP2_01981 [Limihaloglobus sulfuriphilus]